MKAMVLAAGLGTRLRPLTDTRPKALVEVAGRTLLEITLARLREFGVREVIVNAHHFAGALEEYLAAHGNFGMRIEISREDVLLDTGGGLKKAAHFFLEDGSEEPFIVHNVDVLSSVDLRRMALFHVEQCALATLAVQEREASRYLLFDNQSELCGRQIGRNGATEWARECARPTPLAFCGIHVISPRLLTRMHENGVLSIISAYLRLASEGEKIVAFRANEFYWRDLGTAESLRKAAEEADKNALLP